MVGQHSEGSISWIPESSERLSFWVFLLLYIFKVYSELRRFIMFVTNCPRCGQPVPHFESPSHQDKWCFDHRLNGFGEAIPDLDEDDNAPF
jgi:hypothetical protein